MRITQHWLHVHYHYIDHMSSHITNRSHHPRVEHTLLTTQFVLSIQYISSYHPRLQHILLTTCPVHRLVSLYKRSHHPTVQKTTLTTYPLCQVLSLYKIQPSHVNAITLTICPVCPVLSPYQTQPPTCGTQHWPHVQYVQSYHYAKSHHQYVERIPLTTCPVRTFLMMIAILDPTTHIWNTQHWPHVHYA